ncbi:MAG TPA: pyridoxamine 5'-phosphate oxidase family protein [Ilumatobacter sp.]
MADTDMTIDEREAFLADVRVGILSIAREGKGPLAVPIWYRYRDGEVTIEMTGDSTKATLLRRRGRATLTVQDEAPPYRYVSVEGPVTVTRDDGDTLGLAIRYLGERLGTRYARANPPTGRGVVAHLRPEHWLSCDYGKPGAT